MSKRTRKRRWTVVIGAAMHAEVAALIHTLGLERQGRDWVGEREKFRVVVGYGGPGAERAQALAERLIEQYQAERLVWVGFCGGLDEKLPAGIVLVPSWVIDGGDKAIAVARALPREVADRDRPREELALLQRDHAVCTVSEKRELRERYAAAAVDMESFAVAKVALRRRVSFALYRAVVDDAKTSLPSQVARWVTTEGESHARAAVGYVMFRPWKIPWMIRLARKFGLAAGNLVEAVCRLEILRDEVDPSEALLYTPIPSKLGR